MSRPAASDAAAAGLSGTDGAARLWIRAQPGAKRSSVVGWQGDRLKVAIQAPPVDGKANEALCSFFADWLGLQRRAVRVGSGETSRDKRLDIDAPLALIRDRLRDVP